ncbi:MAG: MOSC N-terminal beta barrel domain-containing protein, partial [Tistlia sp.]
MTAPAAPHVIAIQRFPVKALSAESLERVDLATDAMLPDDRRFALVYGDPGTPGGAPRFATLREEPRLAELAALFEADSGELVLSRRSRPVARGIVTEPIGKTLIDQFLLSFLGSAGRGAARLVEAKDRGHGIGYGDTGGGHVSLLNLASVRDLERVTRAPVDPRRFRANFWIEGLPPWVERGWVDRRRRRLDDLPAA